MPCSHELWAVEWRSAAEGGSLLGRVIGWTLRNGAVYPVVVRATGLPMALCRSTVAIYEDRDEAYAMSEQ